MSTKGLLQEFESFLSSIPLEHYRKELMPIKTVEQDLPPALNPPPDIYRAYWTEKPKDFPDYEAFFAQWWKSHLEPLDEFIGRYFWGCSRDFVRLGFKARLYRTLISVLTQFHFLYLWREVCSFPLHTSADLDLQGKDAVIRANDWNVVLSIKKETYRPEARGEGRFAAKAWQDVNMVMEVVYTINPPEEWQRKVEGARKEDTKGKYNLWLFVATKLQRW